MTKQMQSRRLLTPVLALAVTVASASPGLAQTSGGNLVDPNLPTVVVLATGGTIAGAAGSA